jgi:hypothetical protein
MIYRMTVVSTMIHRHGSTMLLRILLSRRYIKEKHGIFVPNVEGMENGYAPILMLLIAPEMSTCMTVASAAVHLVIVHMIEIIAPGTPANLAPERHQATVTPHICTIGVAVSLSSLPPLPVPERSCHYSNRYMHSLMTQNKVSSITFGFYFSCGILMSNFLCLLYMVCYCTVRSHEKEASLSRVHQFSLGCTALTMLILY